MADVTLDLFEYSADTLAQTAYNADGYPVVSFVKRLTGGGSFGSTNYNIRMILSAADISTSGSRIRVKLTGYTNAGNISGISIGERSGSTLNFASTPTRLMINGSNGCALPANVDVYTDWTDFSLDETKDYLIHITYLGPNYYVSQGVISGGRGYKATSNDETLTQNVSGYSTDNNFNSIEFVEVSSAIITPYSESSIKEEGNYALKCVATTDALNKKLVCALSNTVDLSNLSSVTFRIRSSRTGSNIKIGLRHDGGGNDSYTKLLITFNETDAAFTDTSSIAHSISNSGVAYSANGKFAGAGDFGSNDTLTLTSITDCNQNGQWTEDFWFSPNSSTPEANGLFFLKNIANNLYLRRNAGTGILSIYNHLGGLQWTGTTQLLATTQYHIEMSRDEDDIVRVFINGCQEGKSFYYSTDVTGTANALIGWSGYNIDGKVDDFCFSEGICRHKTNFAVSPEAHSVNTETIAEVTPNIASANTWQTGTIDLSGVANADKDAICQVIITCVNADAANTFYLDNLVAALTGLSKFNGVTKASITKINGVAMAAISKFNGVSI